MKGTHDVFEATTIEINQRSAEPQIGIFYIKTNTGGETNVDDFRKISNPRSKVLKKTC